MSGGMFWRVNDETGEVEPDPVWAELDVAVRALGREFVKPIERLVVWLSSRLQR